MGEPANWLPDLVELTAHGGDSKRCIDAAYSEFSRDFITSQPTLRGAKVVCRRDLIDGKESGFWHCISEGAEEASRIPDLRRIERIRWVRAVVEHDGDPLVEIWFNERKGDRRCLIWFREEYLVVLGERRRQRDGGVYWQLITAYCTTEEHRRVKLRRERDEWRAKNG